MTAGGSALGSLADVRVLELGTIGPVPFCGALLADMGADVVRLDRIAPGDLGVEIPHRFDLYNRNKRSIALDLKDPRDVEIARRLAGAADILIEGFRPGVAERLGLGPAECHRINPRLVYGRMTGWGQTGPMAQEAGHDINYAALTGALHCIGAPDTVPPPPLNLVADLGGGALYLALGVLAAVLEARRSGLGQVIDAAMVDGVSSLLAGIHGFAQTGMWSMARGGNLLDGGAPFYGTYRTKDGRFVAVGAIESRFYRGLLGGLGLSDEPLPAQDDRSAWPAMRERFAAIFLTRTRDEWTEAMRGREACVTPVLDLEEAVADPHLRARGTFTHFDDVRYPTPAPRFSRTPSRISRPPPAPGQHGAEIVAEWGLPQEDLRRLCASTQRRTGDAVASA
jgi:alpha-methylacyl-CoA racemase